MMGRLMVVAVMATMCVGAFAVTADDILGTWVTEGGRSHIEVSKENGMYSGTIIWLKEPNFPEGDPEAGVAKHDRENPDPKKRQRPIVGLEVLKKFRYKGDGEWADGTIYDPKNGKTYKCKATLDESGTLNVRGFIGFSLIGRTTEWVRYKGKPE